MTIENRPAQDVATDPAVLFEPLAIGNLELPNRLAVAPMTRVSATSEGVPTERMARYYQAFAEGGFGLVITEGLYTDLAFSQGYAFQPGLATDAHREGWRAIAGGVHAGGARFIAQLMHAGALSQANVHRATTKGPSALRPKGTQMAFYRGAGEYRLPEAMTVDEIAEAVAGFAGAARRAAEAGFDGVEIHAANGYLIDQFLSEATNAREDAYGGDLACRMRLAGEIVHAVRAAVGPDFVVGVRVSQAKVNDFTYKWNGGEQEAAELFRALGALPIDYLHVTEYEAWQPAFGTGPSLASLAREHSRLPVLANGSLHDARKASLMILEQHADWVSLGRGALAHPDWPKRLREERVLAAFDPGILSPIADLEHEDRYRSRAGT